MKNRDDVFVDCSLSANRGVNNLEDISEKFNFILSNFESTLKTEQKPTIISAFVIALFVFLFSKNFRFSEKVVRLNKLADHD